MLRDTGALFVLFDWTDEDPLGRHGVQVFARGVLEKANPSTYRRLLHVDVEDREENGNPTATPPHHLRLVEFLHHIDPTVGRGDDESGSGGYVGGGIAEKVQREGRKNRVQGPGNSHDQRRLQAREIQRRPEQYGQYGREEQNSESGAERPALMLHQSSETSSGATVEQQRKTTGPDPAISPGKASGISSPREEIQGNSQ